MGRLLNVALRWNDDQPRPSRLQRPFLRSAGESCRADALMADIRDKREWMLGLEWVARTREQTYGSWQVMEGEILNLTAVGFVDVVPKADLATAHSERDEAIRERDEALRDFNDASRREREWEAEYDQRTADIRREVGRADQAEAALAASDKEREALTALLEDRERALHAEPTPEVAEALSDLLEVIEGEKVHGTCFKDACHWPAVQRQAQLAADDLAAARQVQPEGDET